MKQNKQLIITLALLVSVVAFAYGALTAPSGKVEQQSAAPTQTPKPQHKVDLVKLLQSSEPEILTALTSSYPQISSDYTINKGKLYGDGSWYGTTLNYRGEDTMNRDTLRVLMQFQDGKWVVRTTPPEILLSKQKYPDVPVEILRSINLPISLPGSDTTSNE